MDSTAILDPRFIYAPDALTDEGVKNIPCDLKQGETLHAFLSRHVDNVDSGAWTVAIGGREIPAAMWKKVKPKDGQTITCRCLVQKQVLQIVAMAVLSFYTFGAGGLAAGGLFATGGLIGGGMLAAAGAYIAGAMIINKVLAPKPTSSGNRVDNDDRSPNFSLTSQSNSSRLHAPIGTLFGVVDVAPDLLSDSYTWFEGSEQYLGINLAAGINVHSVSNVRLGTDALSNYSDVKVAYTGIPGMPNQSPLVHTNVTSVAGGDLNDAGDYITRTTPLDTTRIQLDVEYTAFRQNTKTGAFEEQTVMVEISYRQVGTQAWIGTETAALKSRTSKVQRWSWGKDVPNGAYEVRVRRTDGATGDTYVTRSASLFSMKSYKPDPTNYNAWGQITLTIRATGQLSGSAPAVYGTFTQRPIPVWTPTGWVTATDRASGISNPGAILLQIARGIRRDDGKLQFGFGLPDEYIDIEGLKAFMLHCTANNFTYDKWLTEAVSLEEICAEIALAGMGEFAWKDGAAPSVRYVANGQPKSSEVNMANMGNASFEASYTLSQAADGIEYTFLNRDKDWASDTIRVTAPGVLESINPVRLTGSGVTTAEHAAKLARFHLAQSLYQYKDVGFDMDVENLDFRRLAIIGVSHDLTRWGKGGRLQGIQQVPGGFELTLDAPVTPAAQNYVGLRVPGERSYRTFPVEAFTGEVTKIKMLGAWPEGLDFPGGDAENPVFDTLWCLDFKESPGMRMRVTAITPNDDLTGARISCVPEPTEYWDYIANGTYVDAPDSAYPLPKVTATVSSIRVGDHINVQGDSEWYQLQVLWETGGDYGYSQVWAAPAGEELVLVDALALNSSTFRIENAGEWRIQVRPFGPDGRPGIAQVVNFATNRVARVPRVPDTFSVSEIANGMRRYFWGWNGTPPLNLRGVKIRYVAGTVEAANLNWDTMTPLGGADNVFPAYFEHSLPDVGAWTFAIKAVNTSGLESEGLRSIQKTLVVAPGDDYVIDNTPPPTPTGFTVTAAFSSAITETANATYTAGHGHAELVIYRAEKTGSTTPTFAQAKKLASFNGVIGSVAVELGKTYLFWAKWKSIDGYESTNPTAPITITVGKIGNSDLNNLIVDASKLADNAVSASKLAAGAVDKTKFANGIEPVTIVSGSTLPTVKSTETINFQGKLYRWDGTKYTASVPTTDLSGTITAGQIAAGAVDATKFASSIEPVTIHTGAALPTTKSTSVISWNDKLYRWNGTKYSAEVDVVDLTGQIDSFKLADNAVTVAKIAAGAVNSGKLATDAVTSDKIAAGAVGIAKFAAGLEPVTIHTGGSLPTTKSTTTLSWNGKLYRWNGTKYTADVDVIDLQGQIDSAKLADNAVTVAKIAAGAVDAGKLATDAVTSDKIAAGAVGIAKFAAGLEPVTIHTGGYLPTTKSTTTLSWNGKLYRWNGTKYTADVDVIDLQGQIDSAKLADNAVTVAKIAAGAVDAGKLASNAVTSDKIAAGAVDVAKFAAGLEPVTLVTGASLPTVKSTTVITWNGKLYRWDGAKYSADVAVVDLTGQIDSSKLADNAVTVAKIAAGAVDAGKLATNAVTTDKIAAGAVSTAKFAAGLEPVTIVGGATLPTTKSTETIMFQGKLYRWSGTAYTSAVPTTDLTGTITSAQIAAGAVDATKFASSIEPVTLVTGASLPTTKSTTVINWNNKLYRWDGTKYTAEVVVGDIVGQITATQIADNAITTPKLAANAVDANKIAANAVTAAKIAADAIIAGKIAAGAVNTRELAANSVTANKLVITSTDTVNVDPFFQDSDMWANANFTRKVVEGAPGPNVLATSIATNMQVPASYMTPIDTSKTYLFETWFIATAAQTNRAFASVRFYDANGVLLTGADAPNVGAGWPGTNASAGNYYFPAVGAAPTPTTWTRTALTVGLEGVAKFPPKAAFFTAGAYLNYGSVAPIVESQWGGFRVTEMSRGELIVDGAVTAGKVAANAITANAIAAGAVTAGKIAANAVTANEIAANSITTAKIAAGAVTAAEIAAGAVTADKLIVGSTINLLADGNFALSGAGWAAALGGTASYVTVADGPDGVSTVVQRQTSSSTNSRVYNSDWNLTASSVGARAVTPGDTFRAKFRVRKVSGASGIAALQIILDGTGKSQQYVQIGGGALNLATATAGVWVTFSGTYSIPAGYTLAAVRTSISGASGSTAEFSDVSLVQMATGELIVDGAITAEKIAANTITAAQITAGTVTGAEIAANTITAAKIAVGTITATELATNAVTAVKIAAGAVTAGKIAANAVTANEIAANSITTAKIAAGAVTAAEIAAKAITTDKLVIGNATNLLAEPTFDNGGVGWNVASSSSYLSIVQATGPEGTSINALRLSPTSADLSATNTDWPCTGNTKTMRKVQPGVTYKFTVVWRVVSGTAGTLRIRTLELSEGLTNSWIAIASLPGSSANGTWVTSTGIRTIPADRNFAGYQFNMNSAAGTVFEVASIVMQEMATGELIVDGAITAAKIAANTITAAEIAAGTITATELATGSITTGKIAAGAITATELATNAVTAVKIAAGAVTAGKIAANAVTANEIAANAITTAKIQAGAVTTAELAAGAVTASKMVLSDTSNAYPDYDVQDDSGYSSDSAFTFSGASSSYGGRRVVWIQAPAAATSDATVWTYASMGFQVESNSQYLVSMQTARQAASAATLQILSKLGVKTGNTAVTWDAEVLQNSETAASTATYRTFVVNTNNRTRMQLGFRLLAGAATGGYFGSITVRKMNGGELIVDGAVTAVKVAAKTLTAAQIAAGTITASEIAANTITAANIATGTITANELATNSVTAVKIAAGAVTAGKIAANAVTANEIAANSVTTAKIAAGAVTATEVAAGAILASKIVISDQSNMIADSEFQDTTGYWTLTTADVSTDAAAVAALNCTPVITNRPGSTARFDVFNRNSTVYMSVEPGKVYRLSIQCFAKAGWNGRAQLNAQGFLSNGSTGSTSANSYSADYRVNAVAADTTFTLTLDYTASATTSFLRFRILADFTNAAVAGLFIGRPRVWLKQDTDLLVDGAVTALKVAAKTLTAAQIAAGAITAAEIAANTITAANIATGTITANELATNSVTAVKIAAGAVTAGKIAANAVTANEIAANSVTTAKIAAGAVTATELAAGSVLASKLVVSDPSTLVPDAEYQDISMWEALTGASVAFKLNETSALAGTVTKSVLQINRLNTGTSANWDGGASSMFSLTPNIDYVLRVNIYCPAAATLRVQVEARSPGDVITTFNADYTRTGSAWFTAEVPVRTTGTLSRARVKVFIREDSTTAYVYVGKLRLQEAAAGSLIVDGAIIAAKLATGSVTANAIAANSVTTNAIAANAVTANEIAANSITTAKIAAGAVTADQIAANAITVKHLTVADYSNIVLDPFMTDGSNWATFTGTQVTRATAGVPSAMPGPAGVKLSKNTAQSVLSRNFQTAPGEVYYMSALVASATTTGLSIRLMLQCIDATGTEGGNNGAHVGWLAAVTTTAASVTANAWTKIEGFVTIPANTTFARARIVTEIGTAAAGDWYATNFICRRAASANLIVDGAIVASKLAANSIAVGTAAIQNGAIVNAMIANATIDSAKIANLSAAKLTSGRISVSQAIDSSNYTSGSAGWSINGDGGAEFSQVIVRGTVFSTSGAIGGMNIANGGLNSGAFTGYVWPAGSGTGIHLSPTGLLMGNPSTGGWVEIQADGKRVTMPGFSVINGNASFSGTINGANGHFSGTLAASKIVTTDNLQDFAAATVTNSSATNIVNNSGFIYGDYIILDNWVPAADGNATYTVMFSVEVRLLSWREADAGIGITVDGSPIFFKYIPPTDTDGVVEGKPDRIVAFTATFNGNGYGRRVSMVLKASPWSWGSPRTSYTYGARTMTTILSKR